MRTTPVLAVVTGLAATAAVLAHPDDPKVKDTMPPYVGPAYRADGAREGTEGLNFPTEGMFLLSWLPVGEWGGQQVWANDCWGYTSPSGREYAIIGLSHGTGFAEVTNPGDAQVVGYVSGPIGTWRDIKVFQDHAYAVSEDGDGIQVISMANIDAAGPDRVELVNAITTGGTTATHNVALNEDSGFLYRCGGSNNGLRIYDLNQDPASPVFVASWSDRYVHDAQIVSYGDGWGAWSNREIAFCCAGFNGGWDQTGLTVLDVTDKDNIFELTHVQYPNGAYSHQGWLSTNRQFFYLGDELDESDFGLDSTTHVINVSDPSFIHYSSSFANASPAITHNLYTRDNRIFAANYRSGIRVFDTSSNPSSPQEIAYFDTFPENDDKSFNGLWSCYPYFPSGTVIGSDREKGLFVWDVGAIPITYNYPDGLPELLGTQGATIDLEILADESAAVDPSSATLHYDDGGGFVSTSLEHLGGNAYQAQFPDLACGDLIEFYFSAQTTDGITVTDPPSAPSSTYSAPVATGEILVVDDDFEVDLGWTTDYVDASSGFWERGVPVDDPNWSYDPSSDGDGSGQCWLTQNAEGNTDVDADNGADNGLVALFSPILDMSGEVNQVIAYKYYLYLTDAVEGDDKLAVDISSNGAAGPWTTIAVHDAHGGAAWYDHEIPQPEIEAAGVVLGPNMMLRFTANDSDPQSIVEAGVDGFKLSRLDCAAGCAEDIDGDGEVGITDFLQLLAAWGPCGGCAEDVDGDGEVGITDFLQVLAAWGPC